MKYEKPEIVELNCAINAVQTAKMVVGGDGGLDPSPGYEDWEE